MMPEVPSSPKRTLVIATSNRGKLEELRVLLDGQPVTLVRPIDLLGAPLDVVEDGDTFQANAEIKARAVGLATGELTLADDSGLEVDPLGGLPGVRSARFAGEKATDSANNEELVRRLSACQVTPISARFRCAMALFEPKLGRLEVASGSCEGSITLVPRGSHGFGYDPLFIVTELGNLTMAELAPAEKNRVSHRSRALAAMLPKLKAIL